MSQFLIKTTTLLLSSHRTRGYFKESSYSSQLGAIKPRKIMMYIKKEAFLKHISCSTSIGFLKDYRNSEQQLRLAVFIFLLTEPCFITQLPYAIGHALECDLLLNCPFQAQLTPKKSSVTDANLLGLSV